jgi:penicillin-binding protein 1A
VIATAQRLGIASEIKPHPSLALGTSEVTLLELTAAYAPFANGGHRAPPYGILEIRTAAGEVLYRHEAERERVVAPLQVGQMNAMLREVLVSGTGKAASLPGRPAAGKTGTSQNGRDALFVGYTPDLVAGVWMGRDDARPMKGVTGGGAPARLWRAFMTAALTGVPPRPLPIAPPAPPRPRPRREAPSGGGAFDGVIARLKDIFDGGAAVAPAPAAVEKRAETQPFERRAAPERIRDWQKSQREQFR